MNEIEEIKALLDFPQNTVIITHRNPDGDAIGSSLGLKHFLETYNHNVKLILPSEYPPVFGFLNKVDESIVFDLVPDVCEEAIKNASLIFCLDFNSLDRVDKMAQMISDASAKKCLIDHHLDPEPFADIIFSDPTASSTAELVYQFIADMEQEKRMTVDMGEALFVGLITDTGSFKYSTNPRTYNTAAKLKAAGVDDYYIQDKIFNSMQKKQLELLGHCLANRMEILPKFQAGIIHLTRQDYKDFAISRGDTEGIVNHILMIEGIKIAAFITEQPTIVKLSLRSKGDISVQEIARNHFNGGGHKNASGGSAYAKLEDVIQRFKKVLPKYSVNV